MMNLIQTKDTFQVQHEVPTEAGCSNKADQVEEVVIRVGPEALADAMDQFHQMDKEFHIDESMTMRIPVYRPLEARWLWSILLSFGSGVEVLEPPALRVILKEQLQNALKLYEEV
jgi:predicted DNA-binding transcriptional regulator YafY